MPVEINLNKFAVTEIRFYTGGLYEFVGELDARCLEINSQNCVYRKTSDIKDPTLNIDWGTPQGTGRPNYPNM